MPKGIFVAFDFGFKRIGTAVGQTVTKSASPLITLNARSGIPDWGAVKKLLDRWQPEALIVGLPTCIDDSELYTTEPARQFAQTLHQRFSLPVHLVDERLSTKEAKERLFLQGGYRKIHSSEVDCMAACIILEQWLQQVE